MRFVSFLSGGLNIMISHSSKSIKVIKQSFCQNDAPFGESFWQKVSWTTHLLFELWLIMIFSSPERILAKRTSVHCAMKPPYTSKMFLIHVARFHVSKTYRI
jgi:hypothetical protein